MNNKDDEDWLDALGGKPEPSANKLTNLQAELLRKSMLMRRDKLEKESNNLDAIQFIRMHDRLILEGLLFEKRDTITRSQKGVLLNWLVDIFPSKNGGVAALPVWSLAVNLCLAVVVVFQFGVTSPTVVESDALRSERSTVLIVANPDEKLDYFIEALDKLKSKYVVSKVSNNEFVLMIQPDDSVRFFLFEERISPAEYESLFRIHIKSIDAE